MAGWKTKERAPASATSLSTTGRERIQRLILRAIQHSYGAESALRAAVRSGAAEMFQAGATREAVREAVANCVAFHPASLPDKPSLLTGESRAEAVTRRMMEWTDALDAEPEHQRAL